MAKVEVMSSCLVGMTSVAPMSRFELNPWDLRSLQIVPIQRGLIFHKPQPHRILDLIPHLKSSLSRALDLFPPLAGRLATTANGCGAATFYVDCNNAGAGFTHAVADAVSVSDVIEPEYIPEIVSSLFPLDGCGVTNFEGISKPLVAVQVTELADGLFIGCAANHAVVDGTSFWHFFNSWSEISRGLDAISRSPFFERCSGATAGDENRLVHLPTLEKNPVAPSQLPQRIFHFSKEILGKLKAKANSEVGTHKISSLQAVVAHLWRSTTRCGGGGGGGNNDSSSRETRIMISIGARARVPSLSDCYFGNASYSATMAISEIDILQKGLGFAAMKINELIAEQTNEVITRIAEEKVEFLTLGRTAPLPRRLPLPPLIIASSPRHDVYGCDFGWGKPIGVRSGKSQKVEGLVVVLPAAEAGGIDIEVCLTEKTLKAMEYDAEFMLAFTN